MATHSWDEPIGPIDGYMFDLDGTLILSNPALGNYQVLDGAVAVLEQLSARDVPYLALTNGSAYPASVQAARLRAAGLPIRDDQLFTPNSVAANVLKERGVDRVLVLGCQGVVDALTADGVTVARPGEAGRVDAVYVAWHPDCTMTDIHAGCEAVLDGAAFFTASDAPFFASQKGRSFGYSCAINGAIARVTGREPDVVGKPSAHAMRFVAARLGLPAARIAVVGDDPLVETEMARGGGAIGVGVTTGTTSADGWAATPPHRRPHRVIDHVGDVLALA